MNNITDFATASPRMKSIMVQDGMEHLNIDMAKTLIEIKRLNSWLNHLPGLIETKRADPVDIEQMIEVLLDFQLKVDLFNEQCIVNSDRIRKLAAQIKASQPKP